MPECIEKERSTSGPYFQGVRSESIHFCREATFRPPLIVERTLKLLLKYEMKSHRTGLLHMSITRRDEGLDTIRVGAGDVSPGRPLEFWMRVWQPLYPMDQVDAVITAGKDTGLSYVARAVWRRRSLLD